MSTTQRSSITTETAKLPPVHPGEILREDLLPSLGLTVYELAKDLRLRPARLEAIIAGRAPITADVALRMARYLGTSPEMWLSLQMDYELEVASGVLGERIQREVKPRAS